MKSKKHLLNLLEYSPAEFNEILKNGMRIKKHPKDFSDHLAGKTAGLIFDKSSTRTRVSFEVAMNQLGGRSIFLTRNDLQLGRGESVADTARVLSRYLDAVVIRTYGHKMIEEFAQFSDVPVINALTDLHHPCQTLADYLTLLELYGSLKGLQVVYIGDGNNVAHSLMIGAALCGAKIKIVCPEPYAPQTEIMELSKKIAKKTGGKIELRHVLKGSVSGADAVYTDVWTSMGQEKENAKRVKAFEGFTVNEKLMGESSDAYFMHCLPAHRGEEVSANVMDGKKSVVWDQAENRLHMQKAVLVDLIS